MSYGSFNLLHGESSGGWSSARWTASRTVHAGELGDDQLCCTLQMGNACLVGRGERVGLRCTAFAGTALEGGSEGGEDDAASRGGELLGTFSMNLLMPIKTEAAALEERYMQRIQEHAPFAGDAGALLDDLIEACDEGVDEACDMASKEEAAKRAWLARLESPSWSSQSREQSK